MSKSLDNFTNLLDLVESTDPRAYRLLVLRSHYRTPVEVTRATTDDASAALRRLDAFARRAGNAGLDAQPDAAAMESTMAALAASFCPLHAQRMTPRTLIFTLSRPSMKRSLGVIVRANDAKLSGCTSVDCGRSASRAKLGSLGATWP